MPRTSSPAEKSPGCPVSTTAAAFFAACNAAWMARSNSALSALTGGRLSRSSRMNAAGPLGEGAISWSVVSIIVSPGQSVSRHGRFAHHARVAVGIAHDPVGQRGLNTVVRGEDEYARSQPGDLFLGDL